jgi:putative phosphoesterase
MKRIGLLSDTHGYLDEKIFHYFKEVDEIWHAGDIGDLATLERLEAFKPTRAVFGNIDDHIVRKSCPEIQRFELEGLRVTIMHIAGRPGKYALPARLELQQNGAPDLFVCGHSHIALVQNDPKFKMLWLNPGACGYKGFHQVKTIFRFELNAGTIQKLECIELGPRTAQIPELQ